MQEFPEQASSSSSDGGHGGFDDGAKQDPLASCFPVYGHRPSSPALRHQEIIVVGEALRASHAHRELMTRGGLPCGFAQVRCSGGARLRGRKTEGKGEMSGGIIDRLWEAPMWFCAESSQECPQRST
jgi:hypothetical protein